MPYIKPDDRPPLDEMSLAVMNHLSSLGDLNYLLTMILLNYARRKGDINSYKTHLEIVGTLECVKNEWYRRSTAPLEDQKMKLNGDAF